MTPLPLLWLLWPLYSPFAKMVMYALSNPMSTDGLQAVVPLYIHFKNRVGYVGVMGNGDIFIIKDIFVNNAAK